MFLLAVHLAVPYTHMKSRSQEVLDLFDVKEDSDFDISELCIGYKTKKTCLTITLIDIERKILMFAIFQHITDEMIRI